LSATAIYPGSFDPVTNGHLDIIRRSRRVFDRVIVALLSNPRKQPMFELGERMGMMEDLLSDDPDIDVISFEGLLVDAARQHGASVVIRGLRAISDFEYEFQMAMMNRHLDGDLETMFMVPHEDYIYLSSSLIKEIYGLGGSVRRMVPPQVEERLREHFADVRAD
jgi:pantetheine-phosphate adenylyltransferase